MSTIAGKIDELQSLVDRNKQSLDELEKRLKLEPLLTEKERIAVEDEFIELDESIKKDEEELKRLRGENRMSMLVSSLIMALIAIIYFSFFS